VQPLHTTAYHPQANGLVERFNGNVVRALSKFVCECPTQWDVYLRHLVAACNTARHELLGVSPHQVLMGYSWRNAQFGMIPNASALNESAYTLPLDVQAQDRIDHLSTLQSTIRTIINEEQLSYADKDDAQLYVPPFAVNDRVWLYTPAIQPHREAGGRMKFQSLWDGPFLVTRVHDNKVTYSIQPLAGARYSPIAEHTASNPLGVPVVTVHVSRLKLYTRTRGTSTSQRPDAMPEDLSLDLDDDSVMRMAAIPPPLHHSASEVVHGVPLFEVESIVDRRKARGLRGRPRIEYLIRYRDRTPSDDTWLPRADLQHCMSLVRAYDRSHPLLN